MVEERVVRWLRRKALHELVSGEQQQVQQVCIFDWM